jgi:hypothetical protein
MKIYEESLKTYWDNYSILETAKKEKEIAIARQLKKIGVDIEFIAKATDLTREEIENL